MKLKNNILAIIVVVILVIQQLQVFFLKKELKQQLNERVDGINKKIENNDALIKSINDSLLFLSKKDNLLQKKIKYVNFKIRKNEKSIKKVDINKYTRDSIKRILTAE